MKDHRTEAGEDGQTEYDSIESTTDEIVVADWLTARAGRSRLLVSTHVSLPRVTAALRQAGLKAQVAFADEAHYLAGAGAAKARKGPVFDLCHSDRFERVLFATATPKTVAASVKAKAGDEGFATYCMDVDGPFGPLVAPEISMRAAIESGALVDYQVVVTTITDDDLAAVAQADGSYRIGGVEVSVGEMVTHLAVASSSVQFGIGKMIVFHSTIADSKGWADRHGVVVEAAGGVPLPVTHMDGTTPAEDRKVMLDGLRAAPGIVSNVRVLTAGIDVPALDAVALCAPRRSRADIVQILGRAMRKADGKSVGYMLIPVYQPALSAASDLASVDVADTKWEVVLDVLRQLRLSDESFGDEVSRFFADDDDDDDDGGQGYGLVTGTGRGTGPDREPDRGTGPVPVPGPRIDPTTRPDDDADKGNLAPIPVEVYRPTPHIVITGGLPRDMYQALTTRILTHAFPRTFTNWNWIHEIGAFVAAHGRRPSIARSSTHEQRLMGFLGDVKKRPSRLTSQEMSALRAIPHIADFLDSSGHTVDKTIIDLDRWVTTHDRRPREYAGDDEEKRFGMFIRNVKSATKVNLTEAQAASLRAIPHIAEFLDADRRNRSKDDLIEEIAEWVNCEDRPPRGTRADKVENRLARYIGRVKSGDVELEDHQLANLRAIPHIAGLLDTDTRSNDDVIEEIAEWVSIHDRHPRGGIKGSTEGRLGNFLKAVKYGNKMLDSGQLSKLRAIPHIAAFLDSKKGHQG